MQLNANFITAESVIVSHGYLDWVNRVQAGGVGVFLNGGIIPQWGVVWKTMTLYKCH